MALSDRLGRGLQRQLQRLRWQRIHDYGPIEGQFPAGGAPALSQPPNIDLAVLAFDDRQRLRAAANVLLSRDHPEGLIVGLSDDLTSRGVLWQRWDQQRWDGPKGWTTNPARDANDLLLPEQAGADGTPFMSPYPASLFKLPVAYLVLEQVDAGRLPLAAVRRPLRRMITVSDNQATQELLRLLAETPGLEASNARLRQLGLETIQLGGIDPTTGGNWQLGQITMTALDSVKLLWLLHNRDPERVLWRNRAGQPVRSSLSPASRRRLLRQLGDQAFNEALSTSNFGVMRRQGQRLGPVGVQPGIPARVPRRWIDPISGVVQFRSDGEAIDYGQDVRPFNRTAASRHFAHKTGITYNFGSDAGLVRPLRGQPGAHYAIAVLSNLGYRYADSRFADRSSYPVFDSPGPIAYTQEIPRLGRHVDALLQRLAASSV